MKNDDPHDVDRAYDPYDPEDPDNWISQPVRYAIYGARWDWRRKQWVCICLQYNSRGVCRHTILVRKTDELEVGEEYL